MMREADLLRKAADILYERGWCKESLARDATGKQVDELSDKATQFCMLGSLLRAEYELELDPPLQNLEWSRLTFGLRAYIGNHPSTLAFNDAQESKNPVVKALRQYAKDLENGVANV